MVRWARREIVPSRAQIHRTTTRRLYSGSAAERHARLAFLTPESRRCGIFLANRNFSVSPKIALEAGFGGAARGDFGDQAGQAADGITGKPRIGPDLAAA